jgi:excisionase family DNA binding protein
MQFLPQEDRQMPISKSNATRRHSPLPATTPAACTNGEILTLAETAEYLRVTANEVARLVRDQGLPGRKLGDDWRFLKTALQDWLRAAPSRKEGILMQIGAFKDDPDLAAMVEEIHKQRGRPAGKGD